MWFDCWEVRTFAILRTKKKKKRKKKKKNRWIAWCVGVGSVVISRKICWSEVSMDMMHITLIQVAVREKEFLARPMANNDLYKGYVFQWISTWDDGLRSQQTTSLSRRTQPEAKRCWPFNYMYHCLWVEDLWACFWSAEVRVKRKIKSDRSEFNPVRTISTPVLITRYSFSSVFDKERL